MRELIYKIQESGNRLLYIFRRKNILLNARIILGGSNMTITEKAEAKLIKDVYDRYDEKVMAEHRRSPAIITDDQLILMFKESVNEVCNRPFYRFLAKIL